MNTWEEADELMAALEQAGPEELPGVLRDLAAAFLPEGRPFAAYVRRKFREKGILQQNVFLAADLSENYGYKLIAEEKHTVRRDVILRLCLAGAFDEEETDTALILYGMAPLYPRLPRDAVLLRAIRRGERDVHRLNELLLSCGLPPLLTESE
ncbi:MAG: hypothetical protein IJT62_08165 [Oscillospiraceae bacterium]|nr:hypothetical protein [Oscillospiraceae bacterium]